MASPQNVLPQAGAQARGQAANWQGGYDCDFVQPPPEAVQSECPICHLVLREPYQAPCCGNSFCRTCIEPLRLGNANCPTCRHAGFTTFPDKRLERSLKPLKVYCPHRGEGCEWSKELGALEKHLNENPSTYSDRLAGCPIIELGCLYCAKQFHRRCIHAHEEDECRQRPFSCYYCNDYASTFEDVVVNHHPVCEHYPLPCPNKCDEIPEVFKYVIKRRDLERHVNEECLLTVVECDFHYAGCDARHRRKDMANHLAESLVTHMSLMATHGKKTAADAQRTTTEAQRALKERDQQIAQLQREQAEQAKLLAVVDELKRENKELKEQLELHSHASTPPVMFAMTNFEQHKRNKNTWYSPPFYTHPHGYVMCIKVICKENAVFIGATLVRGKFDGHLLWPFQKIVYIQILNQNSDKNHICIEVDCSSHGDKDVAMRVTEGEKSLLGLGEELPYTLLDTPEDCTKAYIKDNTIQFKVAEVVDFVRVRLLERQILCSKSFQLPPHQIVMTHFEQHKESGHSWISPSFYTHHEGYKMCLQVYANGYSEGKDTHISVFTNLMCGEFDCQLKWPLRGIITIQLVNQLEDKNHHTVGFRYAGISNDSSSRLTGTRGMWSMAVGLGLTQFILNSELGLSVAMRNNHQYLKDNCLIFRIVSVELI